MKGIVINILMLFLIIHLGYAQYAQVIQGRIIDNKTNESIPFATIRLMKGKAVVGGVISNADGSFQFPSNYLKEVDSLDITCIGYSKKILRTDLLFPGRINEIRLQQASVYLKEIVVTPKNHEKLSASKIVRLAIENLQKNYSGEPFSYTGYYRDYQKEEDEYVNLNEAIVKIFDRGFNTNDFDSTKIALYQYRLNKDFRIDTVTSKPYDNNSVGGDKFIPTATVFSFGGNELSILRIHDAIRNNAAMSYSYINEFSSDFVRNHSFKLLGTVSLDNVPLYHISFRSFYFVTGATHFANGEIFIEHGNYGIHKLIYSTFVREANETKLLYSTNVEYTRLNDKLYLNYISFNNFFKANTGLGFKVTDVAYDRVTDAFIVTFNHTPQKATAINEKNYDFRFEGKPFKISRIEISERNDKQVKVFVSNARNFNLKDKQSNLISKFEANLKNIKDLDGREVNEIIYKPVNQFRELFLQKLENDRYAKGLFISKDRLLFQNPIDSAGHKESSHWMNTPLIKNFISH